MNFVTLQMLFIFAIECLLFISGHCLYLVKRVSVVFGYKCKNFKYGCPTSNYMSLDMFKRKSYILIGEIMKQHQHNIFVKLHYVLICYKKSMTIN